MANATEPNCMRCRETVFIEMPGRPAGSRQTASLVYVCCSGCMGVVGVLRDINPLRWSVLPEADQVGWTADPPSKGARRTKTSNP
ncbi:MAG: hypothetical protein ACYDBQ_05195 [Thermoplasmatota archaeon]